MNWHWFLSLGKPEWWLVFAALATLIVIAWQAVEMRRATQAMRDNTNVLIKSQRPHIAAKAKGLPTQTLADRGAPRVEMSLFNRGLTPAYGFSYESWIELLPQPFVDFHFICRSFQIHGGNGLVSQSRPADCQRPH